jgi:hypothetical protein
LLGELEHLKIETWLIDEMFASVVGDWEKLCSKVFFLSFFQKEKRRVAFRQQSEDLAGGRGTTRPPWIALCPVCDTPSGG